jgi:succinate dehydrogenase / fumarate reductase cytochrome b subunit
MQLTKLWSISVGAKMLMAVTGVLLLLFVVGHMVGNWQVFAGPDALNGYAALLHAHPVLLWTARSGLLVAVVLHVAAGSLLTLTNRSVRPQPYAVTRSVEAGLASRNMYLSGAMVSAFVLLHLLQFTWKETNPTYQALLDASGRPDVYTMVVSAFANPWISAVYIVAMLLLGAHLWHGAASVFQSLGITRPSTRKIFDSLGPAVATAIVLGEICMPIAILAGLVPHK